MLLSHCLDELYCQAGLADPGLSDQHPYGKSGPRVQPSSQVAKFRSTPDHFNAAGSGTDDVDLARLARIWVGKDATSESAGASQRQMWSIDTDGVADAPNLDNHVAETGGFGRLHLLNVSQTASRRHEAVAGTEPELAIDTIWSHLRRVNLKNAVWLQTAEAGAASAEWSQHWTAGRLGLSPWPRVAAELRRRGYAGTVCLTAEYSGAVSVERQAAEDLAFARALFA